MPEVQQYAHAELPSAILCQVDSFVRLVWMEGVTGDDRFWQSEDPNDTTTQHFVIVERAVLISHADVVQRTITHAGESYLLYGLGGVFTYPAFRGEG